MRSFGRTDGEIASGWRGGKGRAIRGSREEDKRVTVKEGGYVSMGAQDRFGVRESCITCITSAGPIKRLG